MEIKKNAIDSYEIFKNKAGKIVKVVLKSGINTEIYPIEYDKNGNLMRIGAEWVNYGSISGTMVADEPGSDHVHGNFNFLKVLKEPTTEEEGLALYQCGRTTKNIEITNDETYQWSYNETTHIWSSNTVGINDSTTNLTFSYTFEQAATISFDYSVSSESENYDYIYYTIYKDGEVYDGGTSTKIGGTSYGNLDNGLTWKNISLEVPAGNYKIEFVYRKDSSEGDGDDKGYVMYDVGETCDYTFTAPIPKLKPHEHGNFYLAKVLKQPTFKEEGLGLYRCGSTLKNVEMVNDETYPWSYNETTNIWSSNTVNITSSITTLSFVCTFTIPSVISFDYSVSSESYDYIYYTIYKDGEKYTGGTSTKIRGTSYGSLETGLTWVNVSLEVAEGDYKIEFTYKKDSSGDYGDDKGYVMMHDIGELCDYTYTAPIPKLDIGEYDILEFTGKNFNEAAKKLVSGTSDITYKSTDTDITEIKRIYDYDEFPKTRAVALYNSENDSYLLMSVKGSTSSWKTDIIYLYSDDDIVMLPKDCSYMFYEIEKLSTLNIEYFDSSLTENMSNMFAWIGGFYYNGLTSINLGEHFDTSNVTDMSRIFWNTFIPCVNDLSFLGDKFNTSKVVNMERMFAGFSLNPDVYKQIILNNNFDTSNVTNMSHMFDDFCSNYDGKYKQERKGCCLNLGSNFNTSNVTDMSGMFKYMGDCDNLILGDKFNTSNVTNMADMFNGTFEWSSVKFEEKEEFTFDINFDTSNVTNMGGMFAYFGSNNRKKLTLNLGDNFDTSNVTNMCGMFQSFGGGTTDNVVLNLSNYFNTSNVTNMSNMFQHYAQNTTNFQLNLGVKFDTSNVITFYKMFQECGKSGLTELDLGEKFNANSADYNNSPFRWAIEECGKPPCTIYGNNSIINALKGNYSEDTKTYTYTDENGDTVIANYHNFVVKYS